MSNVTEVFAPDHESLAVPAATVMVFLDGALCEYLEPVEIVRGSWPGFGWARLTYNAAAQTDLAWIDCERIEDRLAIGQSVCLRQIYSPTPPETAQASLPVFAGQIEGIETTLNGTNETVDILVKDYSATLDRVTIYGRYVCQGDGSVQFLSGLDTSFDPSGQANAAADLVTSDGKTYPAFSADVPEATSWDVAGAISYLLGAYVSTAALYWPGLDQLRAFTSQRPVRDLDVTGLSLLEALQRCCESAGLQFRFEPNPVEGGPSQMVVFYRNGRGRSIELNFQPAGRMLSLSRTGIATLHSVRDVYPVTHRHVAQGDFKTYEATFELVQAWDPALEDTNYALFSSSTNPEFYAVKDVYRKWCLNEAGDYTVSPYNQGESFDFSAIFEGASSVRRRRRFWPTLSADTQGDSLGYVLDVSYDGGQNWWTYAHAFDNLLDECGVWLSSDQLDVDTWVAALKDALKVRITASVISDDRITAVAADGPVGSSVPVVDHVTVLPRRFKYHKVSAQSILAQPNGLMLGVADEVDDSAALDEFVRGKATIASAIVEKTQITTPVLVLHVHPGDKVTSSPDSRDLFACRRDNRSCTWIDCVKIDFQKQRTELKLVRQRI